MAFDPCHDYCCSSSYAHYVDYDFWPKIGRTRQDSLANFQGIASESLSEIRLVKSSNAEKQASKKAENDVNALL